MLRFQNNAPRTPGILLRAASEQPPELPAELGRALVADLIGRVRGAEAVPQHERARFVQTYGLEILHRGCGRDRLELMMQRRHAHTRLRRQAGHAEWFGVSRVHPPKDLMDPRDVTVSAEHRK